MDVIFRKNEAETNEIVAKVFLWGYLFVILVTICGYVGIFSMLNSMLLAMVWVSTIPLLLPAFLIYILHSNKPWTKYVLITLISIMIGAFYCIFTFQSTMIFIVPAIIAVLYMNKRLLRYAGLLMCVIIVISHVITGYHLFQPWIEPFGGMKAILQYGALPRCLQYLLCFALLIILNKRHLNYMEKLSQTMREEQKVHEQKQQEEPEKEEFYRIMNLLTDREKDIFLLMIGGDTNMQIADKLCLSVGTVKNYITNIYDKVGNRERTYLILKFSRFSVCYDQSNIG